MAGSDKRISAAQRKKIKVRYKNSGRRKDPATDVVLAAASMVPVAGVGARAAAVGKAASAAAKGRKATKAKKKYEKTERQEMSKWESNSGDGRQPPSTRREQFREKRASKKNIKQNREYQAKKRAAADDDFAAIVAKVAAEGARQSGRKVPARGSAAEAKKLGQAAKRVKKDVKSIRASGSPAKDRKVRVKRRG